MLLILAVLLAGLTTSTPIRVRDGPLIPDVYPAPHIATPTGSGTPATRTPTPRPTAKPTRTPTPTPTTWPISPAILVLGVDLIDYYRIENAFRCGGDGDAHDCMMQESDALVLARIALGEAPSDVNDQVYVMWVIRLRAALGYKNNRYSGGWCGAQKCYIPGRWGEPTTIKDEALCGTGCQFSPARIAQHIYFPCRLSGTDPMRKMLCPTDNQLGDFDVAYRAALAIVDAPLTDYPVALRGYDGFRSPSITGPGQHNRVGGMDSIQFWPSGNVWRDELLDDNIFWGLEKATPTPRPGSLPKIDPTESPPGLHDVGP